MIKIFYNLTTILLLKIKNVIRYKLKKKRDVKIHEFKIKKVLVPKVIYFEKTIENLIRCIKSIDTIHHNA